MSHEKVIAKIRSDVDAFGWHCLSVSPCEGEAGESFTYTIGLVETFDHPEIMIFGLGNKVSHGILSNCVEMIRKGVAFQADIDYPGVIGAGYKVVFKKVLPEFLPEYFGAASRFYGDKPFNGLVMFWPDKAHQFPWQEAGSTAQGEALNIVQQ